MLQINFLNPYTVKKKKKKINHLIKNNPIEN